MYITVIASSNNVGVDDRVRTLEDLSSGLHDYQENYHEIDTSLQKHKAKLDKHMEHGSTAKDSKHLEKIKVRTSRIIVIFMGFAFRQIYH